jgi:hypothetical protein
VARRYFQKENCALFDQLSSSITRMVKASPVAARARRASVRMISHKDTELNNDTRDWQSLKGKTMNRRYILSLSVISALGLALMPASAVAQKSIKDQLLGTWTFVVTEATLADGKKLRPFGDTPKGILVFTEDGRFAQIQVAAGIPKVASNSRVTGTAEENAAVVKGSIALFGTYTVDDSAKTVTYKVDSGTFPNWDGTEQKRPVESITNEELRFGNPGGSIQGATTLNIWKRTK